MSALPNQFINNTLTEHEAYKVIKSNWDTLQNIINENTNNKIKKLHELQSVNIIGQLVKEKYPASKESKVYKLIENNWDFFSKIGVTKPFSFKLSYRAIIYILQLYDFPLKVKYENHKIINREVNNTFNYTEEEALSILTLNKDNLEKSSGVSIYQLNNPRKLAKTVKSNLTYFYRILKKNLQDLEILGCSKTTSYTLTYRGVLYLLIYYKYPLKFSESEQKVIEFNRKPNTEQIKMFLKKVIKDKKERAKKDLERANISKQQLTIVDEALYCIERVEELLKQVN